MTALKLEKKKERKNKKERKQFDPTVVSKIKKKTPNFYFPWKSIKIAKIRLKNFQKNFQLWYRKIIKKKISQLKLQIN